MNPLTSARPKPEQALEFFNVWFGAVPDDALVSVVRIHPGNPKVRSLVLPISDILDAIGGSGLDDLIWDDDTYFDLYFGVSTLNSVPEGGKRGGLKEVKQVPGVWIDLDVKSGSFASEQEALDLLDRLPLKPTAIVSTGLGGLHAYWKFRRPVNCEDGKRIALMWWALVSEHAGERYVDRLCDPSRVLRIPGALRWPKVNDSGTPTVTRSELIECSGVSYHRSEIEDQSSEAWAVHEKRNKETRDHVIETMRVANSTFDKLVNNNTNKWLKAKSLSDLEEKFNETYSWESILIPMGWTRLREDDDGRVFWSRPGDGVRKSATTDWPESPNIMSLFSTAPETGLNQLHDSGILLTKYRVWVQLFWQGNEPEAIKSIIDSLV